MRPSLIGSWIECDGLWGLVIWETVGQLMVVMVCCQNIAIAWKGSQRYCATRKEPKRPIVEYNHRQQSQH